MLRGGASDAEIETAITSAVYNKPQGHCFGSKTQGGIKMMSRIGG